MSHYIETCKFCKTVISQCRCPDPNKVKAESVCSDCEEKGLDDTCASCGSHDCECDHQEEIRERDRKIDKLTESNKKMDKLFWDLVDDREDVKTLYKNEYQMADELARELRLSTTVCKCTKEYTCGLCKVLKKYTRVREEERKANTVCGSDAGGCECNHRSEIIKRDLVIESLKGTLEEIQVETVDKTIEKKCAIAVDKAEKIMEET